MAELVTGRYHDVKPGFHVPVRTTVGNPRWFKYPLEDGHVIAPHPSLLNASVTWETFWKRYYDGLSAKEDQVRATLDRLRSGWDDADYVVLCCFEDLRKEPCHRRVFARWWLDLTGEEIRDIQPGFQRIVHDWNPNGPRPPEQTSLL